MSMNWGGISGGIAGVWEGSGVIARLEIPPAFEWPRSEVRGTNGVTKYKYLFVGVDL